MSDIPKSIHDKIHDLLQRQLNQNQLDLVDIVPIPSHSDRMVQLRTLKEMLEDFDGPENEGAISFFVQIKPQAAPSPAPTQPTQAPQRAQADASKDPVTYLNDGKLNVPFLFRNAELLVSAGDYTLARNIYRTILQTGERSAHALFGVAQCFEGEGRNEEACKHYEESIAYYPALQSYRSLGMLLIRMGKDHQAAEILTRALNLKELSPEVRFELHHACGNSLSRAKKPEIAEAHFKKALEINPGSDEIRSNLGAVYLQSGRTSEAKRSFQDALAANPRNDRALVGIASCFLADGEKRQAHDLFSRALAIELNNPTAIFHLVKCAFEIKSYATAARVLEEYIQIAPLNANLLYSLAGLQFHLGRLADSRTLARIMEIQPSHAGARDLMALIEKQPAAAGSGQASRRTNGNGYETSTR